MQHEEEERLRRRRDAQMNIGAQYQRDGVLQLLSEREIWYFIQIQAQE